jgi:hypothetical protein
MKFIHMKSFIYKHKEATGSNKVESGRPCKIWTFKENLRVEYRGHLRREAMVINDKSLTFPGHVLYPLQTQRLASQFPLEYKVGVRIEPTIKWNCDLIRPSLTLFWTKHNVNQAWWMGNSRLFMLWGWDRAIYPILTEPSHHSAEGILGWQLQNHVACLHIAIRLFLGWDCYTTLPLEVSILSC